MTDALREHFEAEINRIAENLADLLVKKNRVYGFSAFNRGIKGIVTRLEDKVSRIDSLLEGENDNGESLVDSANDLLGYALLLNYAVMNPSQVQEIVMTNAIKKTM